jgi:hypothetical protein
MGSWCASEFNMPVVATLADRRLGGSLATGAVSL